MKAKFKIHQLAAKPVDVELIHPKHGETGIVIKLVGPHSEIWRSALTEYQKNTESEDANLKLMASSVIGWDEEAFEQPYSPEAVLALLSDPANEWLTAQIVSHVGETSLFFQ